MSDTGSCFAVKLDASGARLLYSTRLAGVSNLGAIALDGEGQLIIAGSSLDPRLPVTPGAIQTESDLPGFEGAVLKLGANGDTVVFATYLGGSGDDWINGLSLDSDGNIHLAGFSTSIDFPYTEGALDTRPASKPKGFSDAFVAKIDPLGTSLIYAARPSGSCHDVPFALAVDPNGRAIITGWTCSPDLPVTAGAVQSRNEPGSMVAFATVLSAGGEAIEYSTYLGGSLSSGGFSVLVDDQQRIVITGGTTNPDLATTPDAPARCNSLLGGDFLVRLDLRHPENRFTTYVDGISVLIPGSGDQILGAGLDHITAVDPRPLSGLSIQCVANDASGFSDFIAPQELVTVYGSDLGRAGLAPAAPALARRFALRAEPGRLR